MLQMPENTRRWRMSELPRPRSAFGMSVSWAFLGSSVVPTTTEVKSGAVVDCVRQGIGAPHLEVLRQALGELDESGVVDGIGAAVKQADAAERGIRAARVAGEYERGAVGKRTRHQHGGQEIDVARAGEVLAAHTQVAYGDRVVAAE